MRTLAPATLLLIVSGCATAPNAVAICYGTREARTEVAAAVAEDGGQRSVSAARKLIAKIDVGCA